LLLFFLYRGGKNERKLDSHTAIKVIQKKEKKKYIHKKWKQNKTDLYDEFIGKKDKISF